MVLKDFGEIKKVLEPLENEIPMTPEERAGKDISWLLRYLGG